MKTRKIWQEFGILVELKSFCKSTEKLLHKVDLSVTMQQCRWK